MSDVVHADTLSGGEPDARTACFGVFELDLRSGELRRDGIRVPLQDQPFRVLAFLIERPGDVVTRDELRERLWPSEFVDFDHSLNTAIRKLRAALDDSADNPRFVETLARRGYRFIAPVSWDDEKAVVESASPARAPWRRTALAGLTVVVAFVLVMAWKGTTAESVIDAVAVIPFANDQRGTQHVSDGLTEGLIDELSKLPSMRVMARTTVFRYKGTTADPQRIGEDLEVGAVILGDVRLEGGNYRIRVEMIDVGNGTQLWGDIFHVTPAELPAIQSRVAAHLAQRLGQDGAEPGAQTARVATNAEAYELYLKGLYAWNQRGADDIQRAIEYFKRAADLDPSYAAPHAGIANAWGVMIFNGLISPDEGAARVLAAAHRALYLDPKNAEAYTSLATTKFRILWDFAGAEADYKRALQLNPSYATGHQWYADLLRSMGRAQEARREIETAYKLDPLSPAITAAKCFSLYLDRRYRDAIDFATRAAELGPRFHSRYCLTRSFIAIGEYENAFGQMTKAEGLQDNTDIFAEAYRQSGREGLFRKRLEVLLSQQKAEYNYPVEIAEVYALLGDKDEAFRYLQIGYQQRVSRITGFHINPTFDSLRDDPRFAALLKRIGLPSLPPGPQSSVPALEPGPEEPRTG